MASWKKIVVSGSSAELSSLNVDGAVTGSAFKGDGSGLTNVTSNVSPLAFNQKVSEAFELDSNDDFMPVNSEEKYVIDPVWEVDSNGDFIPRTAQLWTEMPNYVE